MANLIKEAKRGKNLVRIKNGFLTASQQYAQRDPSEDLERDRDTRPPLLYAVEVRGPYIPGGATSYTAQFTEDEMIQLTSEWMTMMHRRRVDAEQERKRKAAFAKGEHQMRDSPLRSRA